MSYIIPAHFTKVLKLDALPIYCIAALMHLDSIELKDVKLVHEDQLFYKDYLSFSEIKHSLEGFVNISKILNYYPEPDDTSRELNTLVVHKINWNNYETQLILRTNRDNCTYSLHNNYTYKFRNLLWNIDKLNPAQIEQLQEANLITKFNTIDELIIGLQLRGDFK